MDRPRLTTVEGTYTYLMASIVLLAVALGAYVLAVGAGLAPDPVELTGGVLAAGYPSSRWTTSPET